MVTARSRQSDAGDRAVAAHTGRKAGSPRELPTPLFAPHAWTEGRDIATGSTSRRGLIALPAAPARPASAVGPPAYVVGRRRRWEADASVSGARRAVLDAESPPSASMSFAAPYGPRRQIRST